jgi:hypothetical protein
VTNLKGKTREQIEAALAGKSRSELLDLIESLTTVEQLLKPAEIARRSGLNRRAVLRDLRDGKFGDYYCRAENSIAVPLSSVNEWRRGFLVPGRILQSPASRSRPPKRSSKFAPGKSIDTVSKAEDRPAKDPAETGLSGENVSAIEPDPEGAAPHAGRKCA